MAWPYKAVKGGNGVDEMGRLAALFKSYPDLAAPESFLKNLKAMIAADRFPILRLP